MIKQVMDFFGIAHRAEEHDCFYPASWQKITPTLAVGVIFCQDAFLTLGHSSQVLSLPASAHPDTESLPPIAYHRF